jgi:type IV secretory pathway ATPase VirB11/archaellum biosynthesis ATPase
MVHFDNNNVFDETLTSGRMILIVHQLRYRLSSNNNNVFDETLTSGRMILIVHQLRYRLSSNNNIDITFRKCKD